jgi:ribonucleoside-triphosphate reductase
LSKNNIQSNLILSDITVFTKYSKYLPEENRRETWEELVTRNMDMHIRKYPHMEDVIREAYQFVYDKKVLPSMRSLQFGGRPIEVAPNRIFNCAYAPAESVEVFAETMFCLLGGTGMGYSVQARHVSKLPIVTGTKGLARRYLVGDSIEGWADAVKVLCESHFNQKREILFDFSDIRAKGALLVTSGGKAPGPDPLRVCLERIDALFREAKGRQLTSLEVHDIMCFIAEAVLTGGIRRAAMICLFDKDDTKLSRCKGNYRCDLTSIQLLEGSTTTYECRAVTPWNDKEYGLYLSEDELELHRETGRLPWFYFEPQRGRSNNSAVLERGVVTEQEFNDLWKVIVDSGAGEPGVYWTNDTDWGTNPCCEIALRPYQFCNLTEINASDVEGQSDLNKRAWAAAIIGTLQAGYTDFHYLRPIWKETTEEDGLIGVGMTGIGSGAVLSLNLKEAAAVVKVSNEAVASLIGINPASRTTTLKPAGTSSMVLGSSSGIHAWHNDYYMRRMRVAKNEAIYRYLSTHHPELVTDEHFSPETTACIEIPQSAPKGSLLRSESPEELLERVKRFNTEWVHAGHRTGANTHNVSCTISVRDSEWDLVGKWMWENREIYNGISVLPFDGGTYIQAPFEDITKERYEELASHLTSIDLTNVLEEQDETDLSGEIACGADGCEIT